jgi:hypothetical protein
MPMLGSGKVDLLSLAKLIHDRAAEAKPAIAV